MPNRIATSRLLIMFFAFTVAASATPVHLRCEYLVNPLGIDQAAPRLSWQSDNSERSWKQAAYQILVASSAEQLSAGKANIWDSARKDSDESVCRDGRTGICGNPAPHGAGAHARIMNQPQAVALNEGLAL